MEDILNKTKSLVIKVGTAGITDDRSINTETITHLAQTASELRKLGKDVTIVTSGAIAAGRRRLNSWGNVSLPEKQFYAAVGQPLLMFEYISAFTAAGLNIGQFLVSKDDFMREERFAQLRDSYSNTLEHGVIPVFNENDTTATDEIRLSDNDELQCLVATHLGGDLAVNLIMYDGLLRGGRVVNLADSYSAGDYDNLGREVKEGRGGLQKKLDAMSQIVSSGRTGIIGNVKSDILGMIRGKVSHTRFVSE